MILGFQNASQGTTFHVELVIFDKQINGAHLLLFLIEMQT